MISANPVTRRKPIRGHRNRRKYELRHFRNRCGKLRSQPAFQDSCLEQSGRPSSPGTIYGVTWTPDGKYVLVDRNLKQGRELWRYLAEGGPGEKLHLFPENTYGFVMHPNGNQLAYTQYKVN